MADIIRAAIPSRELSPCTEVRPTISEPSAIKISSTPGMSIFAFGATGACCGRICQPRMIATIPTGRFTRKMYCQENTLVRKPPTTGPRAAEIKDRHLIDEPYEPEEGGNDPAEDATEPCEQPGEPQVNEIDLSGDDEPVQSPGVLRRRRARAADLQAEADVAIAKMIEAWPVEDWEELLAWVKGVARQIKEGND